MIPLPKNHFSKSRKNLIQNSTCTSPQYTCARQLSRNPKKICGLRKKEKIYIPKSLIFSKKIYCFTNATRQVDFFLNGVVDA
jgi:hypothetical protein